MSKISGRACAERCEICDPTFPDCEPQARQRCHARAGFGHDSAGKALGCRCAGADQAAEGLKLDTTDEYLACRHELTRLSCDGLYKWASQNDDHRARE